MPPKRKDPGVANAKTAKTRKSAKGDDASLSEVDRVRERCFEVGRG